MCALQLVVVFTCLSSIEVVGIAGLLHEYVESGWQYLDHITDLISCFSLQLLVEVCPKAVIEETMLTPVLGLAKDPVPNVRFNAAKTLTKLAPHISKE